ncbi:MAG: hemolysin family protein [bacterium]
MDSLMIGQLVAVLVCVLLSSFFSGSETALTSLGKLTLKRIMGEGGTLAKALSIWLEQPNKVLTTILIGNNIVNILASAITTSFAIQYAEVRHLNVGLTVGIAGVIITVTIIIFGEITPKTFAKHNAERISLAAIRYVRAAMAVLRPITWILVRITKLVLKALGEDIEREAPLMTEEELRTLVSAGEKEGIIERDEREMIHSIMDFGDTTVKEVMVPRVDIVAVDSESTMEDILNLLEKEKHSRIPVYDGTIDNIIGIINVKDILRSWHRRVEDMAAVEFIRLPHFVPETKKVNALLREMRQEKIQMAIVVDEYGGTAGLVTLEDLVEEIVGEIQDEYDVEEEQIKMVSDGLAIVDARADVDDLMEVFGLERRENEEYQTVGGLIIDLLGDIPDVGDVIDYENLQIQVIEADERRILKVKVTRIQPKEEQVSAD